MNLQRAAVIEQEHRDGRNLLGLDGYLLGPTLFRRLSLATF